MPKEKTNIQVRRQMLHWFRDILTCVVEALVWTGCVYAALLSQGIKAGIVTPFLWFVLFAWGLVLLLIVTRLIPSNAYSRTARRDEVVACAMKTALAFSVLAFAVFTERTSIQFFSCLFFFIGLTIERLILNSWFIRYSTRAANCEHAVLICQECDTWQQQALKQNTYGLELTRLEMQEAQQQTAQLLEDYLAAHPETESVYGIPSAMQVAEIEDIAHTCRKQGIVLHLLPLAPCAMPQTMQSECRGTINVLSPAKLPLQSLANRAIKRLTDIVLSLLVLLTVFPVFYLIAFILIKKQSNGPILITQHLYGMNGKIFLGLAFRTRHYEAAPSFFDGTGDPGYFPFGKFLKHSKLELLPQFLCVLWGSMTIVGSESIQPEQYPNYRRDQKLLFASGYRLKAGITSFRFPTETQGSTKADVWYFRNWGFWLDLRIMLQRLSTFLSNTKAKSINYI